MLVVVGVVQHRMTGGEETNIWTEIGLREQGEVSIEIVVARRVILAGILDHTIIVDYIPSENQHPSSLTTSTNVSLGYISSENLQAFQDPALKIQVFYICNFLNIWSLLISKIPNFTVLGFDCSWLIIWKWIFRV